MTTLQMWRGLPNACNIIDVNQVEHASPVSEPRGVM